MTTLNFECPECKATKIEEVCKHAIISFTIEVYDDAGSTYTGLPSIHEHHTDHFQCNNCGWIIRNDDNQRIDELDDLAEWLKQQPCYVISQQADLIDRTYGQVRDHKMMEKVNVKN